MFFKLKFFNNALLNFIKLKKKNFKKILLHKSYIWTKSIGYLNGLTFLTINKKKKRIMRFNQGNIGLNLYYSLYHNKNATFRSKLEQKKREKEKLKKQKEKIQKQKKNAWKTKIIKPNTKKKKTKKKNINISLDQIKKLIVRVAQW